jgi:hypothetical protein
MSPPFAFSGPVVTQSEGAKRLIVPMRGCEAGFVLALSASRTEERRDEDNDGLTID